MRQELRAAFTGWRFWISLLAMILCFLGFSLPEWIVRCGQGDRLYMSAFGQSLASVFFGGAILLFPFLATLPYAVSQVDEIRTGFLFTKAIRTTTMRYSLTKIAVVALSGAAVMGIASLLHSVLWNIVAGVYDPVARPEIEAFFTEGTIFDILKNHPYAWTAYVHVAVGLALTGAVWGVVGLATAVWIPDTLLTVTVPVTFYFFWTYQFMFYLFGIKLPDTSALYNDGQYWHNYFQAVIAHVVVITVASGVYYAGLRRRLQHAS